MTAAPTQVLPAEFRICDRALSAEGAEGAEGTAGCESTTGGSVMLVCSMTSSVAGDAFFFFLFAQQKTEPAGDGLVMT